MNNGLTESENALNCIIENYVNELQRNTCDDDEEDMRIYQEKMEYIKSLKEIVLKDLERLEKYEKLYELIKLKKENAEIHRARIYKEMKKDNIKEQHYDCIYQELKGEIEAYTDIICLIESSGVLNDK